MCSFQSIRVSSASLATLALVATLACETRNPYEIAKQRQQQTANAPATSAVAAAEPTPPTLLPNAIEVAPTTEPPQHALKVDLQEARQSKRVVGQANDPVFGPRLDAIFDGSTSTLSRTEDVNPLVLTFEFSTPIRLLAVRLFPSYSSYDWGVEPAPGAAALVVRTAAAERWSGIELPDAQSTTSVRILMRRLERDNFVHLNELELWIEEPRARSR